MRAAAMAIVVLFVFLSLPSVGVTLAIQRPGNPIGWLLLLGAVALIAGTFVAAYVEHSFAVAPLPGYRLFDWLGSDPLQFLALTLLLFWVPLVFPTGRLPGPRWRVVALAAVAVTIAPVVFRAVASGPDYGRRLPNPFAISAIPEQAVSFVSVGSTVAFMTLIGLAGLSVLLRYRRSAGIERQQLKWFMAAVALLLPAAGVAALTGTEAGWLLMLVTVGFLPVAIGVAVLRYRLYEIDRLISRTIGWALVTGLLVGAFALLVLGSSAVLEPLTGGNTLAVAGSTLVVALLFNPLRTRVQIAVDRRFDRSRYDGERTLAAFGERLRDEVDLPTIRADVLATVETSVRPSRVGLWLRGPGGGT